MKIFENERLSITLMVLGFGFVMVPLPAFVLTISYGITWLSWILILTMITGLLMVAYGTIV
jgi:hypothetical protein